MKSAIITTEEIRKRLAAQGLVIDSQASDETIRDQARGAWSHETPADCNRFKSGQYPQWITGKEIEEKTRAGLSLAQAIQAILSQACNDAGLQDA